MYIQTPGLRPRAAIPRMRAAPTEPARGDGPDTRGARTLHPRPTADRLRRLRQPRQLATPSPSQAAAAAVVLLLPRPISSSSGRPPPPPPSSGSHSSPAELLLQRAQQALVGPRAAASRPQTSRLDRQPAIFRVRRLPDGEGSRPCIRTVAELLARSENGSVSRNGSLNQKVRVYLQGCRTAGQIRDGSVSRNGSLNQKVKG